nr:GAF domain-containing protein [Desulfobacteraceae bacterium]
MAVNTFQQSSENGFIAINPMFKKAGIEILQFALESGSITTLLGKAVQLLKTALNVSWCCVFELTSDKESFDLKFGTNRLNSLIKNCKLSADSGCYPGCALHIHEPFMVEDFATESRFMVPPNFAECGIKSGMSMRLGDSGRPHGVIGVYSDRYPNFTIEDIEFFLAFSRILTSAIIRIQTVDTLKKSRTDLSHAQRIAGMGNWEWDLLTGKVYWSDEIFQIFGI